MKKIISMMVVICMLMCSVTAFADTDVLFDVMCTRFLSADSHTEYSIELDSPLSFISALTDEDYETLSPVDFQQLAESTMDFTEVISTSACVSEDFNMMKFALESEMEVPLRFNDNLTADIWAKVGVWLDMDVSDINKPELDIILKIPFSAKYIVLEYGDLAENGVDAEKIRDTVRRYGDTEFAKDFNQKVIQLVKDNSDIKEVRKNKEYVISIDDAGAKKVFAGMFDLSYEIMKENNDPNLYQFEEILPQITEYAEKFNDIQLLGKDGFKTKIIIDKGKPVSCEAVLDINANIYDIMEAFETDMSDFDRQDWVLDLTIRTNTAYSSVNEVKDVHMPQINEDNSFNPARIFSYEDDTAFTILTQYPLDTDKDKLMIPLRDCMTGVGLYNYSVADGAVTINAEREKYGFENAVFTVGSDKLIIDGEEYDLFLPVEKNENGLIIVPAEAVEILTDSYLDAVDFSFEIGVYTLYFLRNPHILEDVEAVGMQDEYYDEYTDEYYEDNSYSYYHYFDFEGRPVQKNNVYYIPARELFITMGYPVDGMSFENGRFTIKNADGEPQEFNELILCENSPIVYKNGVEISLSNPVREIDGKMFVPEDLFEKIDCSLSYVEYSFNYNESNVSLHRNKYEYVYDYYYSEYEYISFEDVAVVKDDTGYYLPLRKLMNSMNIADENITCENDVVKIVGSKEENGFELITLTENKVELDGVEYTLKSSLKEIDGSKYVPAQFFTDILGGKLVSVEISYGEENGVSYSGRISISRQTDKM